MSSRWSPRRLIWWFRWNDCEPRPCGARSVAGRGSRPRGGKARAGADGESSSGLKAGPRRRPPSPPLSAVAEVKGDLSGDALWEARVMPSSPRKPLLETWLSAASFVSHEDSAFTIGFSTEQRFFRESLSRYEKVIEQAVAARCASPLRFEIVVRADITPAEMPLLEDDEEPSPRRFRFRSGARSGTGRGGTHRSRRRRLQERSLIPRGPRAFEAPHHQIWTIYHPNPIRPMNIAKMRNRPSRCRAHGRNAGGNARAPGAGERRRRQVVVTA